MGIIANVNNYLKEKVSDAANKTADGIAFLSSLSPKQLKAIEDRKKQYFAQKTDIDGNEAEKVVQREMGSLAIEVYQAYLEQLGNNYYPLDFDYTAFNDNNRMVFFDIKKWVTDAEERSLDKLINAYHVLNEDNCNIALIYNRTKDGCKIIIGLSNTSDSESDPAIINEYYSRVIGSLKGNFPGVEIGDKKEGIPSFIKNVGADANKKSVAIVSNVASEKSANFISQSMEKLLDGIVPNSEEEEYTVVLLARPVKQQLALKNRLYEIYSKLAPYTNWQKGFTYSESEASTATAVLGMGAGAGIGSTVSNGISAGIPGTGIGFNTGISSSTMVNFGVNFARASTITAQVGKSENISQTFVNYGIKHTLEMIESQVQRIEESSALGMWDFAAYIISDSPVIANNVAHMYLALTQGEKSYTTKASINFWDGDNDNNAVMSILASVERLQHPIFGLKTSLDDDWLLYPTLVTPSTPLTGKELAKALNFPRKSVSGLPVFEVVAFGREPHSLSNDVLDINIGCGYHMREEIQKQKINISKEELTKHTFITGSTGSGKSNTIYKLLETLNKNKINFLVIEPAKGEYKDVIGKWEDVAVYGTNPIQDSNMLHINPFEFPTESIHILEHLDRLVEIFNVCWPMYAAMPAILKDAVERAYIKCGWNLENSENKYREHFKLEKNLFPTFNDVVKQIREVLRESDYSADNKGDYIGSLVTRLRSLTNGINGLIFTTDSIRDEELFDNKVIIDLSRIGSVETKALIMGLLILKLQEYRMNQRTKNHTQNNDTLKHITVLEEAHNLLKRTSSEQISEGSNLMGKSVEMLANSIAEMRTFGEGFIIADQSPGLLDMSVIRNTNTKIILRLPDYSDRLLVGKAAGLTDNQIIELSKLEKGVAAISQSNWLEPVLCKIYEYKDSATRNNKNKYKSKPHVNISAEHSAEISLLKCLMTKEVYRKGDQVDIEILKDEILKSNLDTSVKCDFLDYIMVDKNDKKSMALLRKLAYDFLNAETAIKVSKDFNDIKNWVHSVADNLRPSIKGYSNEQIDLLMALLIYEQSIRDASYKDILSSFTEIYKKEGGVF